MDSSERQYFELMKTKIVTVMQQTNAGISMNIGDWKGNEIFEFQEDLKRKAGAYFSEKWFYNHFKTQHARLPRIDLLNILSRYVGYIDWSEFKHKNRHNIPSISQFQGSNRIFYILPVLAVVLFLLALWIIRQGSYATYTFCFVDHDSEQSIRDGHIEVNIIAENESPVQKLCDSSGCISYRTNKQKVRFVVKAPYYYTDTVNRILRKSQRSEKIPLRINDYALMINYYSNANVLDWKKRREQLNLIIADSAYICQVIGQKNLGVELYNKTEFIDMLTTPVSSLRHLQILDILFSSNKIISVRFKCN